MLYFLDFWRRKLYYSYSQIGVVLECAWSNFVNFDPLLYTKIFKFCHMKVVLMDLFCKLLTHYDFFLLNIFLENKQPVMCIRDHVYVESDKYKEWGYHCMSNFFYQNYYCIPFFSQFYKYTIKNSDGEQFFFKSTSFALYFSTTFTEKWFTKWWSKPYTGDLPFGTKGGLLE